MAVLKIIGMGVLSLVVISVLVLGYLGFVPGLSGLMGASSPFDLGVKYTASDLASAIAKLGINFGEPTDDSSLSLSGSKAVSTELTNEEMTAMVNDAYDKWKFYPVKDFQIKVGADGKIQASGVIDLSRLEGYADETNVPPETKKQILDMLKMFQTDPKFYFEGDAGITGGVLDGDVDKLTVGNIDVPKDQIAGNEGMIKGLVMDRITEAGVGINNAKFVDGKLVFDGTVPENVGFEA